jgi:hypothetical protein
MKLVISLFSIQILLATSAMARLQVPPVKASSMAPAKSPESLLDASAVATPPGLVGPDIRAAQVGGKSTGVIAPDIRVGQVSGPLPASSIAHPEIVTTLPKGAPAFASSTLTYSFAGKGGVTGVVSWKAPAGVIPSDSKILSFSVLCKKKSQGGPWDSATLTTTFANESGATTVMTVKLSPKVVPMEDGAKVTCGLKDAQGATLNTDETLLTRFGSGKVMSLTGSFLFTD